VREKFLFLEYIKLILSLLKSVGESHMKTYSAVKIVFAILLVVALVAAFSFTEPRTITNWEFVYENNKYGGKINGDIDKLISSAMSGSDIKVILHFESVELYYQMQLSKVKVDYLKKIVTGYNYDFRPNYNEKDVYSRQSSYSTNGEYISIYEGNNDYRSPEIIKVSMSWYVNK